MQFDKSLDRFERISKIQRIFDLKDAFLMSSYENPIDVNEFAKKYNVNRRTVIRDIEELECSNMCIIHIGGYGNKYYLKKGDNNKINNIDAIDKSGEVSKIDKIQSAINSNNFITIKYCNTKLEYSNFKVVPLQLYYIQNSLYIYSYSETKKGYRSFKINRIESVKVNQEFFRRENYKFELKKEKVISSEALKFARFKISNSEKRRVSEILTKNIEELDDDYFLASDYFIFDKYLYLKIFSFGRNIEIVEPQTLKNKYLEYLSEIIKHNNEGEI